MSKQKSKKKDDPDPKVEISVEEKLSQMVRLFSKIDTTESYDPLSIVLGCLSTAGYHRARLIHLTPFDRVIGGMQHILKILCPEVHKGYAWHFQETALPKTDKDRAIESVQILMALKKLDCPHHFLLGHMLEEKYELFAPVVDWCITQMHAAAIEHENYAEYSQFFGMDYESKEEAQKAFTLALRLPHLTYRNPSARMELFHPTIIRDIVANGSVVLNEYIHYAKTGQQIYPRWYSSDPAKYKPEDRKPVHPLVTEPDRVKLVAISRQYAREMTPEARRTMDSLLEIIDKMDIANIILDCDERLHAEADRYYESYRKHDELHDDYNMLQRRIDEFPSGNLDVMTKTFKNMNSRTDKIKSILAKEITATNEKIKTLNEKDDKGLNVKNCPAKKDEAEKLKLYCSDMTMRVADLSQKNKHLRDTYGKWKEFIMKLRALPPVNKSKKPDPNVPEFPEIDNGIADKLNALNNEVGINSLEKLTSLPRTSAKDDILLRDSYMAFTGDVILTLQDYYWKAKLMYDERREMCRYRDGLADHVKVLQQRLKSKREESPLLKDFTASLNKMKNALEMNEKVMAPVKTK
ncbi:hypothetical protein CRE_22340 [Caenorhabditis remanei]|uniref:CCDC93 N-terminal domain-containing protein n=1 Tax=Caenorhabditis remanei TaxID=31234 RepID=E3ME81_CAERE|nr:hypothetical protein CRE_22340 [Caenorhabditis remanei]